MNFVVVIEGALLFCVLILLLTQVIGPLLGGMLLFPLLRRLPKVQDELAAACESKAVHAMEQEIQKVKDSFNQPGEPK